MLCELQPYNLAEQEQLKEQQPLKFRDACGTPQSQMSTAPPTPLHGWALPDSALLDGHRFARMYSAGSSVLCPEPLMSSDEDDEEVTDSEEEHDSADEEKVDPSRVVCVGMPALQSDLGRSAQRVVAAQQLMNERIFVDWMQDLSTDAEDQVEEEEASSDDEDLPRVVCAGMPKLQSDLGQWAQRIVAAEGWLEEKLSTQFIVDDSDLEVWDMTLGVLFRFSKDVSDRDCWSQGPQWGEIISGVDQGDGWVKVGCRYLPIMLDGKQILTPVEA